MENLPNFTLLRSFAVLAEELNFRKTADRLLLDQSALTRRIQKLEYQLGIKLLERTTQSVSLTPAGQAFFRRVQPIIDDYRSAIYSAQMISNGHTGSIRIAYMAFAAYQLMPTAIANFRDKYQDVEVTLTFMPTEQQKNAFANNKIDIGFMYNQYHHADYKSISLVKERLCLVAPKSHPLMQQQNVVATDLANQNLILGSVDMWRDYRYKLKELYEAIDVDMTIAIEVSNTLALIGMVAAGFGVTIYPESLTSLLCHDNIASRPIFDKRFVSETALVWRAQQSNPVVDRFVELLHYNEIS